MSPNQSPSNRKPQINPHGKFYLCCNDSKSALKLSSGYQQYGNDFYHENKSIEPKLYCYKLQPSLLQRIVSVLSAKEKLATTCNNIKRDYCQRCSYKKSCKYSHQTGNQSSIDFSIPDRINAAINGYKNECNCYFKTADIPKIIWKYIKVRKKKFIKRKCTKRKNQYNNTMKKNQNQNETLIREKIIKKPAIQNIKNKLYLTRKVFRNYKKFSKTNKINFSTHTSRINTSGQQDDNGKNSNKLISRKLYSIKNANKLSTIPTKDKSSISPGKTNKPSLDKQNILRSNKTIKELASRQDNKKQKTLLDPNNTGNKFSNIPNRKIKTSPISNYANEAIVSSPLTVAQTKIKGLSKKHKQDTQMPDKHLNGLGVKETVKYKQQLKETNNLSNKGNGKKIFSVESDENKNLNNINISFKDTVVSQRQRKDAGTQKLDKTASDSQFKRGSNNFRTNNKEKYLQDTQRKNIAKSPKESNSQLKTGSYYMYKNNKEKYLQDAHLKKSDKHSKESKSQLKMGSNNLRKEKQLQDAQLQKSSQNPKEYNSQLKMGSNNLGERKHLQGAQLQRTAQNPKEYNSQFKIGSNNFRTNNKQKYLQDAQLKSSDKHSKESKSQLKMESNNLRKEKQLQDAQLQKSAQNPKEYNSQLKMGSNNLGEGKHFQGAQLQKSAQNPKEYNSQLKMGSNNLRKGNKQKYLQDAQRQQSAQNPKKSNSQLKMESNNFRTNNKEKHLQDTQRQKSAQNPKEFNSQLKMGSNNFRTNNKEKYLQDAQRQKSAQNPKVSNSQLKMGSNNFRTNNKEKHLQDAQRQQSAQNPKESNSQLKMGSNNFRTNNKEKHLQDAQRQKSAQNPKEYSSQLKMGSNNLRKYNKEKHLQDTHLQKSDEHYKESNSQLKMGSNNLRKNNKQKYLQDAHLKKSDEHSKESNSQLKMGSNNFRTNNKEKQLQDAQLQKSAQNQNESNSELKMGSNNLRTNNKQKHLQDTQRQKSAPNPKEYNSQLKMGSNNLRKNNKQKYLQDAHLKKSDEHSKESNSQLKMGSINFRTNNKEKHLQDTQRQKSAQNPKEFNSQLKMGSNNLRKNNKQKYLQDAHLKKSDEHSKESNSQLKMGSNNFRTNNKEKQLQDAQLQKSAQNQNESNSELKMGSNNLRTNNKEKHLQDTQRQKSAPNPKEYNSQLKMGSNNLRKNNKQKYLQDAHLKKSDEHSKESNSQLKMGSNNFRTNNKEKRLQDTQRQKSAQNPKEFNSQLKMGSNNLRKNNKQKYLQDAHLKKSDKHSKESNSQLKMGSNNFRTNNKEKQLQDAQLQKSAQNPNESNSLLKMGSNNLRKEKQLQDSQLQKSTQNPKESLLKMGANNLHKNSKEKHLQEAQLQKSYKNINGNNMQSEAETRKISNETTLNVVNVKNNSFGKNNNNITNSRGSTRSPTHNTKNILLEEKPLDLVQTRDKFLSKKDEKKSKLYKSELVPKEISLITSNTISRSVTPLGGVAVKYSPSVNSTLKNKIFSNIELTENSLRSIIEVYKRHLKDTTIQKSDKYNSEDSPQLIKTNYFDKDNSGSNLYTTDNNYDKINRIYDINTINGSAPSSQEYVLHEERLDVINNIKSPTKSNNKSLTKRKTIKTYVHKDSVGNNSFKTANTNDKINTRLHWEDNIKLKNQLKPLNRPSNLITTENYLLQESARDLGKTGDVISNIQVKEIIRSYKSDLVPEESTLIISIKTGASSLNTPGLSVKHSPARDSTLLDKRLSNIELSKQQIKDTGIQKYIQYNKADNPQLIKINNFGNNNNGKNSHESVSMSNKNDRNYDISTTQKSTRSSPNDQRMNFGNSPNKNNINSSIKSKISKRDLYRDGAGKVITSNNSARSVTPLHGVAGKYSPSVNSTLQNKILSIELTENSLRSIEVSKTHLKDTGIQKSDKYNFEDNSKVIKTNYFNKDNSGSNSYTSDNTYDKIKRIYDINTINGSAPSSQEYVLHEQRLDVINNIESPIKRKTIKKYLHKDSVGNNSSKTAAEKKLNTNGKINTRLHWEDNIKLKSQLKPLNRQSNLITTENYLLQESARDLGKTGDVISNIQVKEIIRPYKSDLVPEESTLIISIKTGASSLKTPGLSVKHSPARDSTLLDKRLSNIELSKQQIKDTGVQKYIQYNKEDNAQVIKINNFGKNNNRKNSHESVSISDKNDRNYDISTTQKSTRSSPNDQRMNVSNSPTKNNINSSTKSKISKRDLYRDGVGNGSFKKSGERFGKLTHTNYQLTSKLTHTNDNISTRLHWEDNIRLKKRLPETPRDLGQTGDVISNKQVTEIIRSYKLDLISEESSLSISTTASQVLTSGKEIKVSPTPDINLTEPEYISNDNHRAFAKINKNSAENNSIFYKKYEHNNTNDKNDTNSLSLLSKNKVLKEDVSNEKSPQIIQEGLQKLSYNNEQSNIRLHWLENINRLKKVIRPPLTKYSNVFATEDNLARVTSREIIGSVKSILSPEERSLITNKNISESSLITEKELYDSPIRRSIIQEGTLNNNFNNNIEGYKELNYDNKDANTNTDHLDDIPSKQIYPKISNQLRYASDIRLHWAQYKKKLKKLKEMRSSSH